MRLGQVDLTGAYEASLLGQLNLNTTLGAVKIDGALLAAGLTGTAGPDYMQISRGAINVLNTAFNATDLRTTIYSTAVNGIDLSPDPAVIPDEAIISLTPSHLEFLRQDRMFMSSAFVNLFALRSQISLNFASATLGSFVLFAPTIRYTQSANPFGQGLLFNASGTFENDPAVAANMTTGLSFVGQNFYRANAQTITMIQLLDFLSQPRLQVAAAGTFTMTGDLRHFAASGTIETGATLTGDRVCFNAGVLTTFTGTLSGTNVGHHVDDIQPGVLGAVGFRSTLTAAATTFAIDNQGTAQSRFGGSLGFSAGSGAIDIVLSRLVANVLTMADGDSFRITTGLLFFGAAGSVNLSEGATNRLDLATGDSFRLVSGSVQFAGTAEQINATAGELLLTGATVRTTAELEIDGAFNHDGATFGALAATPVAQTAAYTVTNPVVRRSFDTTTVTLRELAESWGTGIADEQGFGFFG